MPETITSELTVHHAAIAANTTTFRAAVDGPLMAVLKADGFGHGEVARTVLAAGADAIGVTSIAEATAIRATGVDAPILTWLNPVDADFESAVLHDLHVAVPSAQHLHAVARAARRLRQRVAVHLHIDVGMSRDGCAPDVWAALCTLAREHEATGAIVVVGVMGHMSCADRPEDPQNPRERLVFANALRIARSRGLRPRTAHLAATAATLTGAGTGFGMHRIGAGLFGIDPSRSTNTLRGALSLTTTVVAARDVAAGTGVGYGHDHVATEPTRLALLPLGYADGLPRAAAARASVLVRGVRRPLVGRFSMDMVVVDTGSDPVEPGEPVTVFGAGDDGEPTITEWAEWADTIEHEIVTRVGCRSPRVRRAAEFAGAPCGDPEAEPAGRRTRPVAEVGRA